MEHAMCIEDGVIYHAVDFSQQLPDDLDRKRRQLQCPECGGPAFFRNASFNGRAACFGARPHADGCSQTCYDFVRPLYGSGEDYDTAPNHNGKIIVDFHYGSAIPPEHSQGRIGAKHGYDKFVGHHPDVTKHRRLSTLLRMLIELPAFRISDQLVETPNQQDMAAKDFFVPLLGASSQYEGQFGGYWGLISDVRLSDDKTTLWFNSGGRATISFCLDAAYLDDFNQRYRVSDAEDLAGAYILVIGTPRVALNGKLWCLIEEPGFMALRFT